MSYQHSETFAQLKVSKEVVDQNLTSYQWLKTLDHFIENAIDPLVTANCDLVDNYFAKVTAWQSHKPSIKFTREPKSGLPSMLFNSLTTSGRVKRQWQRDMLLNRGLLFGLLSVFADTVNNYKQLHDPWFPIPYSKRLRLMRLAAKRCGSDFLYASITESEFWSRKAYYFKELLLQKYIRLALMQAQRTYKEINCVISLDDIVSIYLSYLSKAIDRCDSRQGVLTTFIQVWFYSARTEVTKLASASNVESYDQILESGFYSGSTEPDSDLETTQYISYEAKRVDPEGVVRFSLGIKEFFVQKQLKIVQKFITTH